MQEFIARENIRRFQEQLDACADPEQRKTLSQLLEAERQQLKSARAGKQQNASTIAGRQANPDPALRKEHS